MPFNKQQYRVTDAEMATLSAKEVQAFDELLQKVGSSPNISISITVNRDTYDRVVTIGKRTDA